MKAIYYVLYSSTSRNSCQGLTPRVMWTFREDIISAADWELCKTGESLEDMAGIESVEDESGNFKPARELTEGEVFSLSVAKLGDDGRMYECFAAGEKGEAEFIEAAENYGLGDEARAIVERLKW